MFKFYSNKYEVWLLNNVVTHAEGVLKRVGRETNAGKHVFVSVLVFNSIEVEMNVFFSCAANKTKTDQSFY